jgi:hypothetical protein
MTGRLLVGAAGVALVVVGAVLLLRRGLADVADAVLWLGGGVLGHDGVLAPLAVVVGAVVVPRLPTSLRPALVVTGVVTATLVAATLPTVVKHPALGWWWPAAAALTAALGLVVTRARRGPGPRQGT